MVAKISSLKVLNILIFTGIFMSISIKKVIKNVRFAHVPAQVTFPVSHRKLFRLQNPRRKEKSLTVLTQNIRTFTFYVVYVPNQIYCWLLGVSLAFFSAFKHRKEVG